MNMFKITALTLAIATTACSLTAMAAETAQIMVKGAVFPSACAISVDGSVDFGNLKKNELQEQTKNQNAYQLGYKPVGFNIQCKSAAKVALTAQADTPVSGNPTMGVVSYLSDTDKALRAEPGQLASLGALEGEDIGYFTVMLASATLDSKDAELISSKNGGSSWSAISGTAEHLMYQDGSVFHGWGKDAAPQEATNISGIMTVSAALNVKVVEELKDVVNFNTNTTLSLHYL
ncbi:TPA: DUF1120 domain-containing protein [Serratia fonticola]|uniref:DUF1120 domain-containing protein n=1 Tax=Serratia fonticola TaxID=47917 RepID=UPI002179D718|nr:DUF1120 domain-containing protein [Serratia fonticola]CAI1929788.1 Protein of uncharacterised function (DUF1120) [Serratia fonticola]